MGNKNKSDPLCIHTPKKGSDSCKGCKFSVDPTLYDGGCAFKNPPIIKGKNDKTEKER